MKLQHIFSAMVLVLNVLMADPSVAAVGHPRVTAINVELPAKSGRYAAMPPEIEAEQAEDARMLNVAIAARSKLNAMNAKRRIDRIIQILLVALFIGGVASYITAISPARPRLNRVAMWLFFGVAICASAYSAVGIYFDITIGVASATSRSGAELVKTRDSPMFWMIVFVKSLAVPVFILVGVRLLQKSGRNKN
ncbi:hypothetical protein [Novilysobacter arseniciresistens]|uniref:hypothetical protein n=1 Tax=Novilysobacter arseniciresistens TaxID=1385522 RepID=UPI00126A717B|nr:hypothetical protein [Lysobacter arseniciresistens]